jgi:hypothetical protein
MNPIRRNLFFALLGKPQRMKPIGRPRSIWKDNVEIYVKGTGFEEVNIFELPQDIFGL